MDMESLVGRTIVQIVNAADPDDESVALVLDDGRTVWFKALRGSRDWCADLIVEEA